ncbi:MAG TPA: response regulator [Melioribacteraceae bacterium]|nr:response regulator [Melioribacteraceae bacterium]
MNKVSEILIVDDEQVVIDSIRKICEINNYKTDSALDAEAALNKIEKEEYRIIICDIMMPGIDGFQFLSELRSRNIDTPVVITSGYSTIENAVKSLYGGALDFIPKPFTFDEITGVIKRCLKYRDLTDPARTRNQAIVHVPCPAKYFRLGYSCWVNEFHDGSVYVGATDIFLKTIENIQSIEFLEIDTMLNQAEPLIKLTSEDGTINQLYSAISGRIIECNQKLLNDITLLEKDPYFEGWFYRMIPSQYDYEKSLLTPCSSDR